MVTHLVLKAHTSQPRIRSTRLIKNCKIYIYLKYIWIMQYFVVPKQSWQWKNPEVPQNWLELKESYESEESIRQTWETVTISKLATCSKIEPNIIKNGLILPTGQWYAPSAVMHGIARYYMVLHSIARYCTLLHGIAWYCMIPHGIAWYCTVLHGIVHGIATFLPFFYCAENIKGSR